MGQRCPECVRSEGAQRVVPTRPRSRGSGAPATKTFIALAVIFWVLSTAGMRETLLQNLAQVNFLVAEGEWWRIFTPVLLHAPGIMHIGFNMYALWILGPQIERGVGTAPFMALYLASAGVGGVFAFYLGDPIDVAVGASGAIFGLFGVWFNWALHRRNTIYGQALLRNIVFLLLINAAIPFFVPSISWQAHLGGLLAGFAIGEVWSRIKGANAERLRTVTAIAVAILAAVAVML